MDKGFSTEPTRLEQALRAKRGRRSQAEASTEMGVAQGTYSRRERGIHRPVGSMAITVATWLGWSEAEVIAASSPAPAAPRPGTPPVPPHLR